MSQVNKRGRFSTLHSSETPGPIFMKLEIYNYFPDTTSHAKFQGPTSTWVVWANSQTTCVPKFALWYTSRLLAKYTITLPNC